MPVVDAYRVNRELKFNGRQYAVGDAIPHDAIVEVDRRLGSDKLGSLLRTRWIEPDPVTRPLTEMTKDELIEHGRNIGAEFQASWKKADIRAAIEEAPHG